MTYKKNRATKFENFYIGKEENFYIDRTKLLPIYIFIMIIMIVLIGNLFSMQILDGNKYLAAANQNYKTRNIIRAPRGVIYSSTGTKLAYNIKVYSVFLDLNKFNFEQDLEKVANLLGMTYEKVLGYVDKQKNESSRITLKTDLSHDEYLNIVDDLDTIEGVYAVTEIGRIYKDSFMYSNILGYIGDTSKDDLNDKIDAYARVGKAGLEKVYDYNLRGTDGVSINEIDLATGGLRTYIPTSAEAGDNLYLNIDDIWQEYAYKFLKDRVVANAALGGAIAIMEIDSGKIKVLATYPTYDITSFTNGITKKEFEELQKNPASPLLDRTIAVALPTGSSFKIITGAIGLEEGVIDTKTTFVANGCTILPGEFEFCESSRRMLGEVNFYKAIMRSSNIYFCNVGLLLEKKRGGINTFRKYTDVFGFGKKTGIDLISESAGSMPSPDLKFELYKETWYAGDLCITAIGQGLFTATPIQMLVATASIYNGGEVLRPQVVDRIEDRNGNVIKTFDKEVVNRLPIKEENLKIVQDAMRMAVTEPLGTVHRLSSIDMYITGKTGTATTTVLIQGVYYDKPHSWLVGVFEHDGKKYAYVINLAHDSSGMGAIDVMKRFFENIL